jgi:cellobiose-specific phosphotransferase system component IIB
VRGFEPALRTAFQGKTIEIRNLSARTQSGVQMAQRIVAEVIPARPDLVIWQTGTVEASRHVDPNDFSESLALGLKKLRTAHIDLVLVGPQTRSRLASMIDVEPYNDLMAQIADRESVPFLSRFDIMTFWEENEVFDIRSQDQAVQMSEAAAQSQCIAQLLADQIKRAVAATP